MTPLRSRLFRRCAAGAGLVFVTVTMSSCGGAPVADGPAVVQVTKIPQAPVALSGKTTLTQFSGTGVEGFASVTWFPALEQIWLPEATTVTAGLEQSTADAGSVFLRVPASWQVVRNTVVARQSVAEDAMTVVNVDKPAGCLVTFEQDGVAYTVSISAAEDDVKAAVMMVTWAPGTASTVPGPGPESAPGSDAG